MKGPMRMGKERGEEFGECDSERKQHSTQTSSCWGDIIGAEMLEV